ncbi:MAG TPA: glycoside hydrolase family 2 protein [Usitatibacter sp.]|jgi:beta-mannosidase|nr:glycoside hydrolase family 2 protein [Usitatibacter sp.]
MTTPSPVEGRRLAPLDAGWELARTAPGACAAPGDAAALALDWRPARVPGTVASSLHADRDLPGAYDAHDWWYRVRFPAPECEGRTRVRLRFEGLATIAEAWLNGAPLASSRNMFVPRVVDVTERLAGENELAIRFASLDAELAKKRPRPRWRTSLVARQDLRWMRTTLLGRMPGWTPPSAPVGPWRPVCLEWIEGFELLSLRLNASAEGDAGRLRIEAALRMLEGLRVEEARIRVGEAVFPLAIEESGRTRLHGDLSIAHAPLWWPHTHGAPRLVDCRIEARIEGRWIGIDAGRVGFRRLVLDQAGGRIQFRVNGVPVFCRGACWTPLDIVSLGADAGALRAALERLRDAGANMLRIPGNSVYESDAFYSLCDELGILVWQDFMFANMDYPARDAAFMADVEKEARGVLERLHRHPCIAVYCGGSEVAQQAAMLGLPAAQWSNDLFTVLLPSLCAEIHPGIPYFPSTPWGGALPFHPDTSIAHYYGVGAYRRPLTDARLARVKFAAECLAFSHVPDAATSALVTGSPIPPPHDPRWKARQPRDPGAGWDFEDVRDHYLRELFGRDPEELRSRDLARYHALSRVVPGELMRRVYAEWRSPGSGCGGALIWLHRDFLPGAGWGIVDATGRPKASYWYLRRAWAPRSVHLTDEGLNGLAIHVVNEADEALAATVEVEMLRGDGVAVDRARHGVLVPPRGALTLNAEAMVGYFADSAAAYRFGPPRHEVIVARLQDVEGRTLSEDFHFPAGMDLPVRYPQVRGQARREADGRVTVTLSSDAFIQAASLTCEGYVPDDNYFHLAPGHEKRVAFLPAAGCDGRFEAILEALNLASPVAVRIERDAGDRAA